MKDKENTRGRYFRKQSSYSNFTLKLKFFFLCKFDTAELQVERNEDLEICELLKIISFRGVRVR